MSDIPIPLYAARPLAKLGEKYAAQMDDALRSLTQSDAEMPLSLVIALMLNFLATQVNPASIAGPIPTSPFANLKFEDKAKAFEALEGADSNLLATLDSNAPEPLKGSLSGLLKFVGGALQEFGAYLSYGEWGVYDPSTKTISERPVGWDLSNYMPGTDDAGRRLGRVHRLLPGPAEHRDRPGRRGERLDAGRDRDRRRRWRAR